VCALVENEDPLIIAVVETHVTKNILDKEIKIKGYVTIRCDSDSRHTGGIVLYVKAKLKYEVVYNFKSGQNFWVLGLTVYIRRQKTVLTAIYHSPNGNHNEFIEYFTNELCEDICFRYRGLKMIVLGDFNFNLLKPDQYTKKILTGVEILGLKQIVREPTRVTQHSETLIDYIITNQEEELQFTTKGLPRIGDHELFAIDLKSKRREKYYNVNSEITFDDWSHYNVDDFQWDVLCADYEIDSEDLNIVADKFVNNLREAKAKHVPKKTIYLKENHKGRVPWLTKDIKEIMAERDRLYSIAKITKEGPIWDSYKKIRN
jgi:exonuclease III